MLWWQSTGLNCNIGDDRVELCIVMEHRLTFRCWFYIALTAFDKREKRSNGLDATLA